MAYRFDGKVIIVTGAASGIGRASAKKLASLGAKLILADINEQGLSGTNQSCGGTHSTKIVDVGSTEACNDLISAVISEQGTVDHVFNCAGVNPTAYPLEKTTDEYWNKLMDTNVKGIYNITRASIPHLKSGASFVNVSSLCGLHPRSQLAIYCATKYAVIGFSKCMALELGPKGIRTNIIAPGFIDTPTNASVVEGPESVERAAQGCALGRIGTAEEVADVVAFLFSEDARYMNGSVVEVDGGLRG